MEHRFNASSATPIGDIIVQRSITLLQGGLNPAVPHELYCAVDENARGKAGMSAISAPHTARQFLLRLPCTVSAVGYAQAPHEAEEATTLSRASRERLAQPIPRTDQSAERLAGCECRRPGRAAPAVWPSNCGPRRGSGTLCGATRPHRARRVSARRSDARGEPSSVFRRTLGLRGNWRSAIRFWISTACCSCAWRTGAATPTWPTSILAGSRGLGAVCTSWQAFSRSARTARSGCDR